MINQPFDVTDRAGQYDVVATVKGGGLSGQAGVLDLRLNLTSMSAMSGKLALFIYRFHAWMGLLSGLFLIFICVSGSLAVFKPEIEKAVDWDRTFNVVPSGTPLTIEQALAVVEEKYPKNVASSVAYPAVPGSMEGHGETYAVRLARSKDFRSRTVLVDPYKAEVVAESVPGQGWGDWVRQLHARFLYGSYWGRWIVGVFGIVLMLATLTGLLIYVRFNAGAWIPKFRRGRGSRILLADLHKMVGLGTLAFNLMFGVTGAVLGLEGLYYRYMAPDRPDPIRRPALARLEPGQIESAVARARELIPGSIPSSVDLNHRRNGLLRVRVETPALSLVKERQSSVLFDANNNEPIDVIDARTHSAGARLYYSMEPLHFGRIGGWMWVKVVWAVIGLSGGFLALSGYAIYLLRWRKKRLNRATLAACRTTLNTTVNSAVTAV